MWDCENFPVQNQEQSATQWYKDAYSIVDIIFLNCSGNSWHKASKNLKDAKKATVSEELMPVAAIEEEYHYKKCCYDENGKINIVQLRTTYK